jgi:serine/threonine protein kinase
VEGTAFGRFRLMALLGRGGMGEVWKAFDTVTERVVALKVLPAQYADDETFRERFRREARSAAGLSDPHVVPIHDFGEIDGRLYVSMRLIEGRDLQSILADGPLEPARAVDIIGQVASALSAAHRVDLVHRDVKPSNILVAEDDFVYLIDFGLARSTSDDTLTNVGSVIGTFAYMAPERVTAGRTDPRSDIYALTCVMHECLTGKQPFPGDSLEQQVGGHLTQPPPRPSTLRANLPTQLDAVVAKGMAKNPDDRYSTTKELVAAARTAITAPIPRSPDWHVRSPQPTPPRPTPPPYWVPSPPSHPPAPRQFAPPSAPSHFAGPSGHPMPPVRTSGPPPATPQGKRHWLAWAAAATALLLVIGIIGVVIVVKNVGNEDHGNPGASAPKNSGPFTGAFRVEFGPSSVNARQDPESTTTYGQLNVRSVCRASTCVATAEATGGPVLQPSFVFDKVDGGWVAVATTTVASAPLAAGLNGCTFPGEYWTVITLRQQSDGKLIGQYHAMSATHCSSERTVTLTRTGDADVGSLPDPGDQAPRVTSPAGGWHGTYHGTRTPDDSRKAVSWDTTVATHCLRTGERCASYAHEKDGYDVLVFEAGKWTLAYEGNHKCSDGQIEQLKYHWEFALPEPAQDPITLLTGRGPREIIGTACSGNFTEDVKYERTGD